jgi:hypothetical protein
VPTAVIDGGHASLAPPYRAAGHVQPTECSDMQEGGSTQRCAIPFQIMLKDSTALRHRRAAHFNFANKIKRIKALNNDQRILTWQNALSMVRAALEGDGALFSGNCSVFRVSEYE